MMLKLLHYPHLLTIHGLLAVIGLLTYVLTTHSLGQRRAPTAAISWTLSIALVPYIGLPVYLLFGTRKLVHAAANRATGVFPARALDTDDAWPRMLTASMGQPPAVAYEDLRLHAEGHHALQALWELIDSADRELLICTFLIGRDAVGKALMARLMDKARAGVRVRLLIDGSGHLMGRAVSLRRLKAAGVEVVVYGPLLHVPFRSRVNLRNHRKLVVVDGARLWCGGRNFAVEYFDGSNRHGRWRDLTFDVRGPLALQARALFERDWAFSARGAIVAEPLHEPPPQTAEGAPLAQVIAAGPDESDDTVHDLLVSACFKAKRHIVAATPYFVPGPALLMALSLAARRGVTVDVVLPAHSNHRIADFVRYRAMRELAAAGGRIWLSPCMLHAKAVVIDDSLALAGSANLDARSMFLNYEVMVAFYDGGDIRRFADFIEKHRASAVRYQAHKPGLLRDLGEGLLLWLAFQL